VRAAASLTAHTGCIPPAAVYLYQTNRINHQDKHRAVLIYRPMLSARGGQTWRKSQSVLKEKWITGFPFQNAQ